MFFETQCSSMGAFMPVLLLLITWTQLTRILEMSDVVKTAVMVAAT